MPIFKVFITPSPRHEILFVSKIINHPPVFCNVSGTPYLNADAAISSTMDAPTKEPAKPKWAATSPDIIGPVVCPVSIMEPKIPMADPRLSFVLRSAMSAEVAEVTMEMLKPNRMQTVIMPAKCVAREKAAIHAAPATGTQVFWGCLPCLSENLPIRGLETASVIIWEERHIPI